MKCYSLHGIKGTEKIQFFTQKRYWHQCQTFTSIIKVIIFKFLGIPVHSCRGNYLLLFLSFESFIFTSVGDHTKSANFSADKKQSLKGSEYFWLFCSSTFKNVSHVYLKF